MQERNLSHKPLVDLDAVPARSGACAGDDADVAQVRGRTEDLHAVEDKGGVDRDSLEARKAVIHVASVQDLPLGGLDNDARAVRSELVVQLKRGQLAEEQVVPVAHVTHRRVHAAELVRVLLRVLVQKPDELLVVIHEELMSARHHVFEIGHDRAERGVPPPQADLRAQHRIPPVPRREREVDVHLGRLEIAGALPRLARRRRRLHVRGVRVALQARRGAGDRRERDAEGEELHGEGGGVSAAGSVRRGACRGIASGVAGRCGPCETRVFGRKEPGGFSPYLCHSRTPGAARAVRCRCLLLLLAPCFHGVRLPRCRSAAQSANCS